MRKLASLSAAFGAALAAWLVPSAAGATVCFVDPSPYIGAPISASMHLGSLLPAGVGLGVSGGERGWKTTAFITAPLNYAGTAAMLVVDGMMDNSCGGDNGLGPFHPATVAVEGVSFIGTTTLLVAALVMDEPVRPPVMGYVAPREGGAVAGVGFAY
jgi:hypothetical protein